MNRTTLSTITAILTLATLATHARAQAPQVPRYAPPTPTTSRYLTLFQGGIGGAVSSYYGVIRPQGRQAALIQQQQRDLRLQGQQINNFERGVQQTELRPTGRAGWFSLPSERNTYRNRSHYYARWEDRRPPGRR